MLEGDTLQAIAQRVYGNSSLWYAIAAANAVTDATLVAGTTLKVPSIKTTANDASTFKPYDPNAIQGPTTPGLPYITPPPKQHCSALATIIRIVAAVVVLVITRDPQLAWSTATTVGVSAAVAGTGEALAQTVEIQEGVRSSYDWGGVALSAVTAGFGATSTAASFAKNVNPFLHGVIMAGVSNLAGYALRRAFGQDVHFSLRALVSDALAAGIGEGLLGSAPTQNGAPSGTVPETAFSWGKLAMEAVKSVVRQGISHVVHKAIEGQAHWNNGQVLGSMLQDVAVARTGMWLYDQKQEQIRQAQRQAEAQRDPDIGSWALSDMDYQLAWGAGAPLDSADQFQKSLKLAALMQAVEERGNLGPIGMTYDANGKPVGYYVPSFDEVDSTLNPTTWRTTTNTLIANTLRYHISSVARGVNIPYDLPDIDASPVEWVEHNHNLQYWLYGRKLAAESSAADTWLGNSSRTMFELADFMQGKGEFMGMGPVKPGVDARDVLDYMDPDTASSYAWSSIPSAIGGALAAARLFTNNDVRVGVAMKVAHPVDTTRSAWQYWTSLSGMGKLDAVYSLGSSMVVPGLGASKLLGRTSRATGSVLKEADAVPRIAGRIEAPVVGGVANGTSLHPLQGLTREDVVQAVQVLGVKTERDSLLLWSGLGPGDQGILRSQAYAAEFGGTTLEMTPGGSWLHSMDLFGKSSPFTRLEAKKIWGDVSEMTAQQASGQVRVAIGWLQEGNIFEKIELPTLRANPNVTGIDVFYLKSKYGITR